MHSILLPILTLFLAPLASAATPTTNPRTTTYRWIPKPATLLSEIPGSGVCDEEIEYCMKRNLENEKRREKD
ncbi:hypothetical protein J4E85_009483 [Alternaria conjuncta]|uniref:uncharacterized protein n=1 Tax=Alternaria conjuncta TaxID=181017 RepID=UPI0022211FF1|nr:uncharacterized protein J4E85_009483 [Alternaria conjuncta]KAI4919225.1 hypothetical protein J4E85_009483 [Alternaria conjuncta]